MADDTSWRDLVTSAIIPGIVGTGIFALVSSATWLFGIYALDLSRGEVYGVSLTMGTALGLWIGRAIWREKFSP